MQVIVIRSFVDAKYGSHGMNDIIELPEDVDWLKAGLVLPIEEIEAAAIEPPEKAVRRKPRRRTAKRGK